MKKVKVNRYPVEKGIKGKTTNYAQSSHEVFCKRCSDFNNGCPNKIKFKGCNL